MAARIGPKKLYRQKIGFKSEAVALKFADYPSAIRRRLMTLRRMIFETAAAIDGVGEIEETLKWGELAYVTARSGTGSTIRIDWKKSKPAQYAMYFNCQTTLVDTFRTLFQHELNFEGNRAIVFGVDEALHAETVALCIEAALTYHRSKRRSRKAR